MDVTSPRLPTTSLCTAADHVSKRLAYYIHDNCPYPVYAVDPEHRNSLIPSEFMKELYRYKEPWSLYSFKLHNREIRPLDVALSMRHATKAPCLQGSSDKTAPPVFKLNPTQVVPAPKDPPSPTFWTYNWQLTPGTPGSCQLPPAGDFPETSLLAIYNSDSSASLTVKLKEPRRTIMIPPQSGTVFKGSTNDQWLHVADYQGKAIKDCYINPLVCDDGPLLSEDSKIAFRTGEFYLLPYMVQDLVEHNTVTRHRPGLCKTEYDVKQEIDRLQPGQPVSLLLQHYNSPHMCAVLLLKTDDNNLIAYVHKTLEPGNFVELDMLHAVGDAMGYTSEFDGKFLLSPEFQSQKDFSACGTFATDALIAFENKPDTFKTWLVEEVQRGRNTLLVQQNYAAQYTHCDIPDLNFTPDELVQLSQQLEDEELEDEENEEAGQKFLLEAITRITANWPPAKSYTVTDLGYVPTHCVHQFCTDIEHTPAVLLKLFQCNPLSLANKLEQEMDDNKTTLGAYRLQHTHKVLDTLDHSPDKDRSRTVFLGALCERYHSMSKWAELKRCQQVQSPQQCYPKPMIPEETRIHFPYRVRHAESLTEAREWFKANQIKDESPTPLDFEHACDFEEFVTNNPAFDPAKARGLEKWLKKIMPHKACYTPREQLLKEWLEVSMHAGRYKGRKLKKARKHLKRISKKFRSGSLPPRSSGLSSCYITPVAPHDTPLLGTAPDHPIAN